MTHRARESEVSRRLELELGPDRGRSLTSASPVCDDATVCGCDDDAMPTLEGDWYPVLFRRVARRAEGEEARACRDRAAADGLYEELMRTPAAERSQLVDIQDRYASFAFAERLLSTSLETRATHPEASQELARLALGVADRLDPARYGAGLVADLKARSWAYLGDAWSRSAPAAASEAFRLARSHLRRGSGDPLEEAEVLALAAGGPTGTADPDAALGEIEKAEAAFLAAGDLPRLAETLRCKANLAALQGEPRRAVRILRDAATVLGEAASPSTLAEIGAEIASQLEAAGCPDDAWTELARVRSQAGPDLDPALALRLRWIEGRVAATLGLADEARGHLEAARDGFLAAGDGRDAAATQFDLAALATRATGPDLAQEMERLVTDVHRLVVAARLPREHTTALLLIGQAAESGALRPNLVESVAGYLRRLP